MAQRHSFFAGAGFANVKTQTVKRRVQRPSARRIVVDNEETAFLFTGGRLRAKAGQSRRMQELSVQRGHGLLTSLLIEPSIRAGSKSVVKGGIKITDAPMGLPLIQMHASTSWYLP
jgi:hypothetical protein